MWKFVISHIIHNQNSNKEKFPTVLETSSFLLADNELKGKAKIV